MPQVLITDFETALKNALETVFPSVSQQICLWHVQKNAVHNVKKKWVPEEEEEQQQQPQQPNDPPEALQEPQHIDPAFQQLTEPAAAAANEEPAANEVQLPSADEERPLAPYYIPSDIPRTPIGFLSIWKAVVYAASVTATTNLEWRGTYLTPPSKGEVSCDLLRLLPRQYRGGIAFE